MKLSVPLLLFAAVIVSGCTQAAVAGDVTEKGSDNAEAHTFVVTGENFKFRMDGTESPDIRVKVGERIRIEFTSTDGFHDWKVDEFSAATKQVQSGESAAVEFVADKKGTFEYYCSVGQHRAFGMKGKLIVE